MLYTSNLPINWIIILTYSLITFHLIKSLMFLLNKKHFFKNMNKNLQIIKYMNY